MEIYTHDVINAIAIDRSPGITYDPTSIAYIYVLFTPYIEELLFFTTYDYIVQWLNMHFPGDIGNNALQWIEYENEGAGDYFAEANPAEDPNYITELIDVKRSVIKYLIIDLINAINDILGFNDNTILLDTTVLPWDIQKAIYTDTDYKRIFGIIVSAEEVKFNLPITANINGTLFNHDLNLEQTCGILLSTIVIGVNYNIEIYGAKISIDYMRSDNRFTNATNSGHYIVDINNKIYVFSTPYFIQGFITGCQWAKVDHKQYWKNLISFIDNKEGIPITF